MAVAIDNFSSMKADAKVVILGGMRELGHDSKSEHRALFERVKKCGFKLAILVGDEFRFAEKEAGVVWCPDCDCAKAWLEANPLSGALVLVKGSNSNKLWQLESLL